MSVRNVVIQQAKKSKPRKVTMADVEALFAPEKKKRSKRDQQPLLPPFVR